MRHGLFGLLVSALALCGAAMVVPPLAGDVPEYQANNKQKKKAKTHASVGTNGASVGVSGDHTKLNVGPSGPSLSVKGKGGHVSVNSRGRVKIGF